MPDASQVKVIDKFEFPLVLNMDGMVSPSDATIGEHQFHEYELSAVLLHKGSNATSGHYGPQASPVNVFATRLVDAPSQSANMP